MRIATADLTILVLYTAATIAFGLWISRGQKNAADYLLGGRDLPWWALLISIVATETSTATFLSVPGIAHGSGDMRFLQLPLGYIIGRTIATTVLVPLYFKGRLFTAYEVLRERSGPAVRTLASGLFLVTRTLADGLRLFLAALVLKIMLGCELWVAVAAVGLATVVYTVLGGIKAVVWTDVIQFVVYMFGAIAALFVLHGEVDGGLFAPLGAAAARPGFVFDFGWDLTHPYTFWAGILGGTVLSVGSHGVDQLIVQRFLSARTLGDAKKALFWSGPVVLIQFALFLALGIVLAAFYLANPPAEPFDRPDAVFADFIVNHLPVGLVGIVLGSVFSAAMSTLSSSLAASASALMNDFVLPITGHKPDEPFALRGAKLATVLFAILQMAVGMSDIDPKSPVVGQVLAIGTITTGIILGLFLLALPQRRSPTASLVGLAAGLLSIVFVLFAVPGLELLGVDANGAGRGLAWPWFGVVSCGTTCFAGFLTNQFVLPRS